MERRQRTKNSITNVLTMSYTLFVPLRSTMMIESDAPEGSSKKTIMEAVTQDDLMEAVYEICSDDLKDSWFNVKTEDVWIAEDF